MTIKNINITKSIEQAQRLLDSDAKMSDEVRAVLNLMIVVVTLLIEKLGLNSSNSSQPPSTDPNRKKKKKTRSNRKPGGQKGRKGVNLKQVEDPDIIETIEIDRTTIPAGDYREEGFEKRQVFDITISRTVTEYQAQVLVSSRGKRFVAPFPEGVSRPAQYGSGLKAHAVYMSMFQLLPYDRIRDYFADQGGVPVSAGSLVNFNQEACDRLEEFEEIVREKLIDASHAHVDETGINIDGKRRWLHCVSSLDWTLYYPHEKRGGEAIRDMGVLENFRGVLCHDHWKPYFQLNCLHALCNAHHLRELELAWDTDKYKWAKNMQLLLCEINDALTEAGGVLSADSQKAFRKRYRSLLTRADRECPAPKNDPTKRGRTKRSKSRNLLERLRDYEEETLRFMSDPDVAFTNNLGENDIRMTKVQQKISGCFRSMNGAETFCRIRSYLSTCRKQGMLPTEALNLLFKGDLPEFITHHQNGGE